MEKQVFTDAFMDRGYSHLICEDYFLHGNLLNKENPYVIVADGCSTSEHTDVGARILSHCAKLAIEQQLKSKYPGNIDEIGLRAISQAMIVINSMNLPKSCLNATLLMMYIHDNRIIGGIFGDGILIKEFPEYILVTSIRYGSNAPYYLTYRSDNQADQDYRNQFECTKQIITIGLDKSTGNPVEELCRINNQQYYDHYCFVYELDHLPDLQSMMIASDGIESFMEPDVNYIKRQVTPDRPIFEMIQFKNRVGQFIQRRINKRKTGFLTRCKELEWSHFDDLTIAGISFG